MVTKTVQHERLEIHDSFANTAHKLATALIIFYGNLSTQTKGEVKMTPQIPRYLIVFNAKQIDRTDFTQLIPHYQILIHRLKQSTSVQPEWHIVFVEPAIPACAMVSNELVELMLKRKNDVTTVLNHLNRILNIPQAQHHVLQGQSDLQAHRLAKQINATTVLGYSKTYLKWQGFQYRVRHTLMKGKRHLWALCKGCYKWRKNAVGQV